MRSACDFIIRANRADCDLPSIVSYATAFVPDRSNASASADLRAKSESLKSRINKFGTGMLMLFCHRLLDFHNHVAAGTCPSTAKSFCTECNRYSSSVKLAISPAPAWMKTRCPFFTISHNIVRCQSDLSLWFFSSFTVPIFCLFASSRCIL